LRKRPVLPEMVIWLACGAWLAAIVLPLVWVASLSLKTRLDALSIPPAWFFKPTLDNYYSAIVAGGHWRSFMNSLIISTSSTVLALVLGVPAAYVFSRFAFNLKPA